LHLLPEAFGSHKHSEETTAESETHTEQGHAVEEEGEDVNKTE